LDQLAERVALTGARVENETFAGTGRPEPFQDGGDGFGGGGVESAFDLGHEAGHYMRNLLVKKVGSILVR
jgi:hypothetical protein